MLFPRTSQSEKARLSRKPECPLCHGNRIYRSARRGMREWLLRLVHIYPFRCDICGYRFRRYARWGHWGIL